MLVHMYYLMMKTAVRSDLNSNTFRISKSHTRLKNKEIFLFDFKFYQKLLIVFITMSTILIFPESPSELENICNKYNPRKLCNVW